MVTFLTPKNRRVSMWAWIEVDSPGSSSVLVALAVTQPQETLTPEMWTGLPVLLVSRKGCVSAGPRATEPKSLESSSNMASAQEPAKAGAARHRLAKTLKT